MFWMRLVPPPIWICVDRLGIALATRKSLRSSGGL